MRTLLARGLGLLLTLGSVPAHAQMGPYLPTPGSADEIKQGNFKPNAVSYNISANGLVGLYQDLRLFILAPGSGVTGSSAWAYYIAPTFQMETKTGPNDYHATVAHMFCDSPNIVWDPTKSKIDYLVCEYAEAIRNYTDRVNVAQLVQWKIGLSWFDGRLVIRGQPQNLAGQAYPGTLDVQATPGQTVPLLRILNAAGTPVWCVKPDGSSGASAC